MQGSKIRLSPAEAALFGNSEIILTKNSILQKTVALLSKLQDQLASAADGLVRESSPKISRGENYLGLPYVILDYPRIANGEDLFFIRSLFWWGNFYSSTLQLAGRYKDRFLPLADKAYDGLKEKSYCIGINQNPWLHHFEPANYRPVNTLSKAAFSVVVQETPHTKIAARWPLAELDSAEEKLVESWKFLAALVKAD